MTDPKEISDPTPRFDAAKAAGAPEVYFNGFAVAISSGDISVVLERNQTPVTVLNLSYTVAKTLALSLGSVIGALEEIAQQQMLTTHELDKKMAEHQERNSQ